jgi:hypothetical protein
VGYVRAGGGCGDLDYQGLDALCLDAGRIAGGGGRVGEDSHDASFGPTGRVKVTLNGTTISEDTGLTLPAQPSVTFGIGPDLKGSYPAMTATFDNIVVRRMEVTM